MNTEYRFERLDDTNVSDLLPLYLDAFKEVRLLDTVKAKFDTACFGAKNIAFIAYDKNNTAAAFYALFPVIIRYNEKKIVAAQVGDLMTHSQHRRKGLFLELAHLVHQLALAEGIELIFTVPYGENSSYKGFLAHLHFKKVYTLNEYLIQTNALPIATLAEKNLIAKRYYTKYANYIIGQQKNISGFSENKLIPQNFAEVLKDKTFFDYKKFAITYTVEMNKVQLWFKIKKGALVVGDIRHLTVQNAKGFIRDLKQLCFKLGIRSAQFDVAPNSQQDLALSAVIKPIAFQYNVLLLSLSNTSYNNVSFCLGDLDNF